MENPKLFNDQKPLGTIVPKIQWWQLRHLPQMLSLARLRSTGDRPTKKLFLRWLSRRNAVGQVLISRRGVLGYIIYEVWESDLHIVSLSAYNMEYAQLLLRKILEKASAIAPMRVTIETRETCVDLQLLLRTMGFKCYRILPEWYEDTNESSFLFENVQFLHENKAKTEVPHLEEEV